MFVFAILILGLATFSAATGDPENEELLAKNLFLPSIPSWNYLSYEDVYPRYKDWRKEQAVDTTPSI